MPEARFVRPAGEYLLVPAGATDDGEIWFAPDGAATRQNEGRAGASGTSVKFISEGKYVVNKAAGAAFVSGAEVWWDYSALAATYKPVNDRDAYLGTAVGDSASADNSMEVDFNKKPAYARDLLRDAFKTVLVGTVAAGGFGYPVRLGGAHIFELSTTNEAQKVDALGLQGFSRTSNFIVDIIFRVMNGGAGAAPDCNIGLANATHASDFDSITEYLSIHIDGNNTNINVQSKDGGTTVASTDTTLDYTAGSDFGNQIYVTIDGRDEADIQVYVNGALVLGSSIFKLDAAVGPLYPIVHLEKTAAADVFKLAVDKFAVRLGDQ